jgi:hypothetical protein
MEPNSGEVMKAGVLVLALLVVMLLLVLAGLPA